MPVTTLLFDERREDDAFGCACHAGIHSSAIPKA